MGTEELQFAHVRPTKLKGVGRGKSRRLLDVKHHPSCYELMCGSVRGNGCHEAFDRALANWGGQANKIEDDEDE